MLFISFEGIDGSGKTTIAKLLKEKLKSQGYEVVLTREPGGNEIAEQIRDIILSKKNSQINPWTEALLYIAARKQHVSEDILPALKRGAVVLCDRFMDSTSAYQGYARGLGIRTLDEVQSIVLGTTKPDLTLFFDIEPTAARGRMKARFEDEMDRLDLEKQSFHEKVYEGYQVLISEHSDRIKVVDARKSINEVLEQVSYYIDEVLTKLQGNKNDD
ncbi:thymidylate kinase [Spiroplasma mirum ATCC 29335]|uniref:Thymidylate kinase n=1 Tax=Spiroplasma mirum ATCC 29335 TaxID=838561 RepID=W0GJZ4_9MOLU|nr:MULTISPECIES: dTMP kinase [Spiroplasma]AHF60492.1 Thymidylate kinase [Spiroplasma mirum ATCC 29335]AHI57390.1 thymidylate kinase [Spiroplasma mirum ATCC 29335]AKM52620.1 thymidylate kinase [Spiroplasma atrichopogonis]